MVGLEPTLATSHSWRLCSLLHHIDMAKAEGIEPTSIVLETIVLPLNYALLGRCLTNHSCKVYYSTLQLLSFQ